VLENLHEQYLLPPLHAGWAVRRKSTHFSCYDDVAKKFAKMVEIDPWMINPYFAHVEGVDFQERTGEEALADAIDGVLKKIAKKYREYGFPRNRMLSSSRMRHVWHGVMTVHDASEVAALTKRERAKMAAPKTASKCMT
jgi:Glutamate-cysteine ligase.